VIKALLAAVLLDGPARQSGHPVSAEGASVRMNLSSEFNSVEEGVEVESAGFLGDMQGTSNGCFKNNNFLRGQGRKPIGELLKSRNAGKQYFRLKSQSRRKYCFLLMEHSEYHTSRQWRATML